MAMQGDSGNIWGSFVRGTRKAEEKTRFAVVERFYSGGTLHVVGGDPDFNRGLVYFSGVTSRNGDKRCMQI